MATENRKNDRLIFSHKEATAGTPDTNAAIQVYGVMPQPRPVSSMESDKNKLGTGQGGTQAETQSLHTPFSLTMVQRLSELAYLMSYGLGFADTPAQQDTSTAYTHPLRGFRKTETLTMPTMGFQYGDGTTNDVYAHGLINDFSLTFNTEGSPSVIESTFNGFCNGHSRTNGVFAKLPSGSFASGTMNDASEPLINPKCCKVYLGSGLEGTFTQNYTGSDLADSVDISEMIKSITITYNNGMTADNLMRADGCGLINDQTHGVPSVTLEINWRKDTSKVDVDALQIADTARALEILFVGNEIETGYNYAMDLFVPKFQMMNPTEDDETPVNETVTTEVFSDSNDDQLLCYVQSALTTGYNAVSV